MSPRILLSFVVSLAACSLPACTSGAAIGTTDTGGDTGVEPLDPDSAICASEADLCELIGADETVELLDRLDDLRAWGASEEEVDAAFAAAVQPAIHLVFTEQADPNAPPPPAEMEEPDTGSVEEADAESSSGSSSSWSCTSKSSSIAMERVCAYFLTSSGKVYHDAEVDHFKKSGSSWVYDTFNTYYSVKYVSKRTSSGATTTKTGTLSGYSKTGYLVTYTTQLTGGTHTVTATNNWTSYSTYSATKSM